MRWLGGKVNTEENKQCDSYSSMAVHVEVYFMPNMFHCCVVICCVIICWGVHQPGPQQHWQTIPQHVESQVYRGCCCSLTGGEPLAGYEGWGSHDSHTRYSIQDSTEMTTTNNIVRYLTQVLVISLIRSWTYDCYQYLSAFVQDVIVENSLIYSTPDRNSFVEKEG